MLFSKIITQNPTKYDTIYVSKLFGEEYIMFNGLDITLINSYDSHSKLYFSLTVRTHQNAELWGRIINNEFIASAYGKVIMESLDYFDSIHECVHAEHTAVMPNHIHVILSIEKSCFRYEPTVRELRSFLSDIADGFKQASQDNICTFLQNMNSMGLELEDDLDLWHEGCSIKPLDSVREYGKAVHHVKNNVALWGSDRYFPM